MVGRAAMGGAPPSPPRSRRPTSAIQAMPATRMTAPMGVKSKKPKLSMPARRSSAVTTRLGGVPMSVSMPPIMAATASGISRLCRARPVCRARPMAMGMKTATAPVELMNAERKATASIMSATSRTGSAPARAMIRAPTPCATPVR